jgi:hypothetical protein
MYNIIYLLYLYSAAGMRIMNMRLILTMQCVSNVLALIGNVLAYRNAVDTVNHNIFLSLNIFCEKPKNFIQLFY